MLESAIIVVHLLVAIAVVALVLLQQGKGADAGASFGAGASATVFGGQGSATFLSRLTGILAAVFFVTSVSLAYFAKEKATALSGAGIPAPGVVQPQSQAPKQPEVAPSDDVPVVDKPSAPASQDAAGDEASSAHK